MRSVQTIAPPGSSAIMLDQLLHTLPRWLEGHGNESDVIISSRIRLARNLANYPFASRATREEFSEILDAVFNPFHQGRLLAGALTLRLEELEEMERQFLLERRLISPYLIERRHPSGLVVGPGELLSVMINEEDHLRIQSIQSGLAIHEAWKAIRRLDDELSNVLDYAYSDHFGYLTACPTNTGTGMRVSLFVHLPALAMVGKIEELFRSLIPEEMTVRGFYGEGTEAIGNVFQISNRLTLGRTEEGILHRLEFVGRKCIEQEREARRKLLEESRVQLEDKVFRARAILMQARLLSSLEFMNLLSGVRLGCDLGLFDGLERRVLNEVMILAQPAHLQKLEGRPLSTEDRDVRRASLVQQRLRLDRP